MRLSRVSVAHRPGQTTIDDEVPAQSHWCPGCGSTTELGVELVQEEGAPLLLVRLADCPGALPQSLEGAEETPVRLVAPTHIARAPPSGRPQSVEAAVIPDAGIGIRLDIVAGEFGERRPRLEMTRVCRRGCLCCLQAGKSGLLVRPCEGLGPRGRWLGEHRLGKALAQIDRQIIRHGLHIRRAERLARRGISFHDMKNRSRLLETTRGALVGLCLCLVLAACGGTSSLAGTKANETTTTSTTTTTTLGLPQPTASKPITILDVGDSLGEDLGLGLGYTLGNNPLVRVVQAARGDTGLARPDYYNWPAHFAALLNEYHPQVVTILIGGNDSQSFDADNQVVVFGTSLWRTIYTERVELMMHEAQEARARLLWVGLPIMQNPVFGASMQTLNAIYKAQAALHRGVEFMSTWALFSNAEGQYSAYLTKQRGPDRARPRPRRHPHRSAGRL